MTIYLAIANYGSFTNILKAFNSKKSAEEYGKKYVKEWEAKMFKKSNNYFHIEIKEMKVE